MGRSGVYCAVSNVLEQCKLERVVDVFQAVKTIRTQKPGAITTVVRKQLHKDSFMQLNTNTHTHIP